MPVPPCVDNTCSVSAEVDGDGHLELSVILGNASLECDSGLKVNLDAAGCNNLLELVAGGLIAHRPKAGVITFDGTQVDYPADSSVNQSSGLQIHNTVAHTTTHDCVKLLLVTTRWQFIYGLSAGTYNSDGVFYADIGGDAIDLAFRIDGTTTGSEEGQMNMTHTHLDILPANTSIAIQSGGKSRTTNEGTVNGAGDNGIRTFHRIVVVELDVVAGNNGVFGQT